MGRPIPPEQQTKPCRTCGKVVKYAVVKSIKDTSGNWLYYYQCVECNEKEVVFVPPPPNKFKHYINYIFKELKGWKN